MIKYIKNALEFAVDLLYPELCMFCDGALGGTDNEKRYLTCKECFNEISIAHKANNVFCLLKYEGKAENIIKQFKYNRQKRYAYSAGLILAKFAASDTLLGDILIPIPLYTERQKKRGYNQAEVICKAIANETKLPIAKGLKRVKNTPALYGLTRKQREKAILGAFEYIHTTDEITIKGKTIILVDDILTSGATFNECAKVLIANGAMEVKLITFAYTQMYNEAP